MSDELRLNDNPSVETQLYVMAKAINSLLESSRKHGDDLGAIKLLQREQNGNVALALSKITDIEHRLDAHDDWHGEEDEKITRRVHQEELMQAHTEGVKSVLVIEWKFIKWVAGGGLVGIGLAVGKFVNVIGWW